jgi:tripartite-type tricarboxylate transporter receptor subunit TctC
MLVHSGQSTRKILEYTDIIALERGRIMRFASFLVSVFVVVSASSVLMVQTAEAQVYPVHPINLIVPLDTGSAGDMTARVFADELSKKLKTSVVVINRPGAGTTSGTDAVVKSKKDGYTLLYATTASVVYAKAANPESVPYDPLRDLEPLGLQCFFPCVWAVQQTSPWKTFDDLIEHAKRNPGVIRVSTPGLGATDHFNLEIVKSLTGTEFNMVPFKSGNAALTALLGGHVDVASVANPMVTPHVKSGKLRMLLLTKKMAEFADIPTIADLGYKEELLSPWFALFAPVGIPEEVKRILVPAIEKALKNPELEAKIQKLGFINEYRSPEELRSLQSTEYTKARSIAIKLGLGK